ncbi:MAG: PhzF family phenazine biosynthesis protein [Pseudonocardiaceae bacterium]
MSIPCRTFTDRRGSVGHPLEPVPELILGQRTLAWIAVTADASATTNAVLEAQPDTTYGTGALRDLLAVFPDEAAVRRLAPDLTALTPLTSRDGIRGVIATAPASDPGSGYDFVSRFFAPAAGIPEDPVTGSAHTALAPYWSARLGHASLTGLQASTRTGLVRTTVHRDRVHLTGHAVTVLDGTLHHPPR